MRRFLLFACALAGVAHVASVACAQEKDAPNQPTHQWQAHEGGWGLRIAISPDGKRIATAGSDKRGVHVWDAENPGRKLNTFLPPYRYWSLAFDPTSTRLMAGGGPALMVWHLEQEKTKALRNYQPGIWGGTFLDDGRIVSAGWNRTLRVYDEKEGQLHTHRLPRNSRCIVPVGKNEVALSQFDRDEEPAAIEVRHVETGRLLERLEGHSGTITCIDVCPTNRNILVSSSSDRSVRVWDRETEKQRVKLAGHGGRFLSWCDSARFSPDGAYIATCADLPANRLMVWHLASGRLHWKSAPVRSGLIDLAFFPDKEGYRVAAIGKDNGVRIWKVEPDAERYPLDLTKTRAQIFILANQVQAAAKDNPEAGLELGNIVLTLWENIAEIYPAEYVDFLVELGDIQRRAKQYKESVSSYEKATKILDANYRGIEKFRFEGRADLNKKLGVAYALSGDAEKAEALLAP